MGCCIKEFLSAYLKVETHMTVLTITSSILGNSSLYLQYTSHLQLTAYLPPSHLWKWAWIMTFQFSVPCYISPSPRGQTGGQNALCSAPGAYISYHGVKNYMLLPNALCNKNSPWGKDPDVKTLLFPLHCRDNQ